MEDDDAQLNNLLAVLRAVPGVSGVSQSKYSGPELNKMNIFFRVQPPDGGDVMPVRTACNQQLPTKLAAARDGLRKLELIVGEQAIRAAEQHVADAAAGSTSTSAAADPPAEIRTVGAVLGATQRLQAELRAAELRADGELQVLHAAEQAHDAARAQVAEARAALDEHTKRQRTEPAQVSLAPTCALARGPRSPPARRPHPARVRPANFPQFRRQASLDASTVPEHPRVKLGGSNPPNWHKYERVAAVLGVTPYQRCASAPPPWPRPRPRAARARWPSAPAQRGAASTCQPTSRTRSWRYAGRAASQLGSLSCSAWLNQCARHLPHKEVVVA